MGRSRKVLLACLFLLFFLGTVHWEQQARSANLASVTATLSTPRLSFSGLLSSSNTAGSTTVSLQTALGSAPSTSSANLTMGDTVQIGNSSYTVQTPSSGGTFTITSGLQASDDDLNDPVIVARGSDITVNFSTVTAIPNGTFRILVPAATSSNNDALPDQDGWDFGGVPNGSVTVTCPGDLSSGGNQYDFGVGAAAAGSQIRAGRTYHVFTCTYTGSGGSNTAFQSSGQQFVISELINPAPATLHSEGLSDTYDIIVEHLDNTNQTIDSAFTSVAVVESVRVSATISEQITFYLSGVNAGTSVCGASTSVTSEVTGVPLGQLSTDTFRTAAQELVVSTNADNGYVVTAIEADQLRRSGASCAGDSSSGPCIPDAQGDNNAMTHTTFDTWLSTASKGFGYSLQNVNANSVAFEHGTNSGGCNGTPGSCYKQFADAEDSSSQPPQQIFSSSTTADSESVYVCYKAIVSSSQQAGSDYATQITYRATASF